MRFFSIYLLSALLDFNCTKRLVLTIMNHVHVFSCDQNNLIGAGPDFQLINDGVGFACVPIFHANTG